MFLRMFLATSATFGILFGFVGVILILSAWQAGFLPTFAIFVLTVGVNLIGWLVAPFFTDLFQGWVYKIRKLRPEEFAAEFPEVSAFLQETCRKHRVSVPRMRIVEDDNPTAYTYGTLPFNARVVLSRGIFKYLDVDEQCAVLAHELGHIKHLDFALMTAAATLLQLLYEVGHVFIRTRGRNNPLPLIGLLALVFYWVGTWLFLYLSRAREYLADWFSAKVMGDPAPLQRALVKVAYGLVEQAQAGASSRLLQATRAMGISDPKAAATVANAFQSGRAYPTDGGAVLQAVPATGGSFFDARRVEPVLLFDLFNPWAWIAELSSTHPLTGRRLRKLNEQAMSLGRKPLFDFAAVDRDGRNLDRVRLYGKFAFEVCIYFAPWAGLGLGMVLAAITAFFTVPFFPAPILGLGLGLVVKGIYRFSAGRKFEPTTMYDLMCDPYASPLRGRPVELQGRVVGKAQAGAYFGEDMAMKDVSGGLVNLNYESWFPVLGNLVFGFGKASRTIGQDVVARGWFRRSVFQFVDLADLQVGSDRVSSWTRFWAVSSGFLVSAAGLASLVLWAATLL